MDTAEFSGYLTIKGYRSTVFETPNGDQWGQKSEGTPAMASIIAQRVAAQYLQAQKDLTTQLKENLEGDEMSAWNKAAQEFFSTVQDKFLPDFEKIHNNALEEIDKQVTKLPKADHPRVDGHEAAELRAALEEYVGDVRQAKDKFDSKLVELFQDSMEEELEKESEPTQIASILRKIANAIDNSKNPKRDLIAQDLKMIIAIIDK